MLTNLLSELTVDLLKQRIKFIKKARKVTRKDDLIKEISKYLLSDSLIDYWQLLDKWEKLAVAESLYHWNGQIHLDRFKAKYAIDLTHSFNYQNYYDSQSNKKQSALCLFFINKYIPQDLQLLLKKFVQEPAGNQVLITENLPENYSIGKYKNADDDLIPIRIINTETMVRHDLSAVLNLIKNGQITVSDKTSIATSASIRKIEEVLLGGDYFQLDQQENLDSYEGGPIRPIRPYAWPLLLQSSSLVKRNGKKLALTAKGIKALSSNFYDCIKEIYQSWLKKGLLDEFKRINLIKGQTSRGRGRGKLMSSVPIRRVEIDSILCECPDQEWIAINHFFQFIQAGDSDLKLCNSDFGLYLADRDYGALAYAKNYFEVHEGRYILVYLFEYLATLGMIDIAYIPPYYVRDDYQDLWGADEVQFLSRYDGLLYFKINPLGWYCMNMASQYKASEVSVSPLLQINKYLEIELIRKIEADELQILKQFAVQEEENYWILSEDLTLDAIDTGQSEEDFYRFLEQYNDKALPEEVIEFFKLIKERATSLIDGGMALIIHSSSSLIKKLCNDPGTKNLCQAVNSKSLIVTTKKEKEFSKAIKKMGYLLPNTSCQIREF